jgi:hypothetical protein
MQPPAEVEPAMTRKIEQSLSCQHLVVDVGGAREIAAGEAHLAHAIDDRARVEALDVDMLDNVVERSSALRCALA